MIKTKLITSDYVLAAILAVVLSFALFGNGIGGDFVFDDTIVIVGNPFVNGKLNGFWEIFTDPYFAHQPRPGLYRPLTIASYALNDFVFGQSPVSFHVVNVFLHALVSFLVFVLLRQLSNKMVGFIGLLFFILLPIHVEAVTSIVGRAEILSLLFVLGAILFSLRKKYIIASVLFLCGLLSKEMAIAFLPIFLFLKFSRSQDSGTSGKRSSFRDIWRRFYYFIPALVIYGVLRYVALGGYFLKNDATPVYNPIKFTQFLSGLATSFKVFYLYLEKTFYPLSLSSDYSFNQIPLVNNPFVSVGAMLGIVILGLIVLLFFKTNNFLLRFGVVTFLASYFVVSNWIFRTGTIMAERLMYSPSLGLTILVAVFLNNLKLKIDSKFNRDSRLRTGTFSEQIQNSKFVYFGLAVVFVWYGFIIIDRNRDWRDNKNLYESAFAAAPGSIVNQTNMAYLDFVDKRYNEAENRLDLILEVAPEHVPALNLAGQNYKKLGQYQKAEDSWKKALGLRSDYLRAYLSLGILYYENGYFKSAEKVLADAVNIYPRWSEVLFLALTKVGLEKPDEAIALINKHFGEEPAQKEFKFALGWAYFNKGEREMALRYFDQVKDPKIDMDDFIGTFENSKVIILGEY